MLQINLKLKMLLKDLFLYVKNNNNKKIYSNTLHRTHLSKNWQNKLLFLYKIAFFLLITLINSIVLHKKKMNHNKKILIKCDI